MTHARLTTTLAIAAAASLASSANAGTVDIVNANNAFGSEPGTPLHSNGGLDPNNFSEFHTNGVSLALRAREGTLPSTAPSSMGGQNVYNVGSGGQFSIDFNFIPRAGDTTSDNYFLRMELDSDPSAGTNFAGGLNTFEGFVFDADSDDELLDSGRTSNMPADISWDDGDSVAIDGVTTHGGMVDDFAWTNGNAAGNEPAYVVSNSWQAQWDFANFSLLGDDFGGDLPVGLYDIRLTVLNMDGAELAGGSITAQVVPMPTPAMLGAAGLGGLAMIRRRR